MMITIISATWRSIGFCGKIGHKFIISGRVVNGAPPRHVQPFIIIFAGCDYSVRCETQIYHPRFAILIDSSSPFTCTDTLSFSLFDQSSPWYLCKVSDAPDLRMDAHHNHNNNNRSTFACASPRNS